MAKEIVIVSGDSKILDITITEQDGSPTNLNGCSIKFLSPKLSKDAQVTNALQGQCEVSFAPGDTLNLKGMSGYDIKVTDSLGNISTVVRGMLRIS